MLRGGSSRKCMDELTQSGKTTKGPFSLMQARCTFSCSQQHLSSALYRWFQLRTAMPEILRIVPVPLPTCKPPAVRSREQSPMLPRCTFLVCCPSSAEVPELSWRPKPIPTISPVFRMPIRPVVRHQLAPWSLVQWGM
jgi:hypothetical protein